MNILILEDNSQRVETFIELLNPHNLVITENANVAIEHLTNSIFDIIFLDHDLGEGNGTGSLVSSFLSRCTENRNNESFIVIHSWNIAAVEDMKKDLPQAHAIPFASNAFYEMF